MNDTDGNEVGGAHGGGFGEAGEGVGRGGRSRGSSGSGESGAGDTTDAHDFGVDIGYEGGSTGSGVGDQRGEDTGTNPNFGLDVDLGVFGELDRSVSLSEVSDLADSFGFDIDSEVFGGISGRTAFDKTLGLQMDNPYAQARDTFTMLITVVSLFAPPTLALALDIAKRAIAQIQIEPTVSVEEYADIMFELWSRATDPAAPDHDGTNKIIRLVDALLQTETGGALTFADTLDILDSAHAIDLEAVVVKPIFRRRSNIIGTGRLGLTIE